MIFWVVLWLVGEGGGVKNMIKYFSGLIIHKLVLVLGSIEKGFFNVVRFYMNSLKFF